MNGNEGADMVEYHYVITVQYSIPMGVRVITSNGIIHLRPGVTHADAYQKIMDNTRRVNDIPDDVPVFTMFFLLTPNHIPAPTEGRA